MRGAAALGGFVSFGPDYFLVFRVSSSMRMYFV